MVEAREFTRSSAFFAGRGPRARGARATRAARSTTRCSCSPLQVVHRDVAASGAAPAAAASTSRARVDGLSRWTRVGLHGAGVGLEGAGVRRSRSRVSRIGSGVAHSGVEARVGPARVRSARVGTSGGHDARRGGARRGPGLQRPVGQARHAVGPDEAVVAVRVALVVEVEGAGPHRPRIVGAARVGAGAHLFPPSAYCLCLA